MTEEVKQNLIDRYVMLLQIKAAETGTNKVLDIQLAVTKVKLSSYNIEHLPTANKRYINIHKNL
ncbi:hypothetical protein D3Z60_26870 [Lachnospiraceae bacterium]|jgi:hypothetical protein|nr:hypothetical protein [Lachnospiraceae bacterium]